MIYGLLTFFDKLNLPTAAQPISAFLTEIFSYVPNIGAAIGLTVLAWVLAGLAKLIISKGAEFLNIDQRLSELEGDSGTGTAQFTVATSLAAADYWFFLLFLPMILGALNMQSLVSPLQDMFSKIFTHLPNIFSAILIFVIGNFVARIRRMVISSPLAATGIDNLSQKAGLQQSLSTLVGTVAFTVVLMLVIVQSLEALQIEAITSPAKQIIDMIFLAVPGIISAIVVFVLSYYVGKLLAGVISNLLTAAGFNQVIEMVGINVNTTKTPSEFVGSLVLIGVILFALLGATELLGFEPLGVIVDNLINFTFQAIPGALILGVGIVVANKVRDILHASGFNSMAGMLAEVAILVLSTAMGLRQIGLAEDIINMAFGILLGAIGIGLAIAIGLGSKDVIGGEIERLIGKIKDQQPATIPRVIRY